MRGWATSGGDVKQSGEVFQILARGQFPVDAALTGQHRAQTLPHLIGLLHDVEAVHAGRAARRFEQCAQHADRRGFAGAVRSQQAEDFALLDVQIDAVDGGEPGRRFLLAPKWPAAARFSGRSGL